MATSTVDTTISESNKANVEQILKAERIRAKKNDTKTTSNNSLSISGCSTSSVNDSPPLTKHLVAELKNTHSNQLSLPKESNNNVDALASNNVNNGKVSLLLPSYRSHLQYFRKLFAPDLGQDVVNREMLVDEFHCALLNKILMQGKMYMSLNYVCFYSNLLVQETRFALPFKQIKSISKAYLLRIIPNAIEITTLDGRQYFISSFINRDQAFDYLIKLWQSAKEGSKLSWLIDVCPIIKNSYTTDSLYYELEQGENVDLTLKVSSILTRAHLILFFVILEKQKIEKTI